MCGPAVASCAASSTFDICHHLHLALILHPCLLSLTRTLMYSKHEDMDGGGGEEEEEEEDLLDRPTGDFSKLKLKPDHEERPLWILPEDPFPILYFETFSRLPERKLEAAYDFVIAVAEPVARPKYIHQYRMTEHSLFAAGGGHLW